jgi:hypothetical protein
VNRVSKCIASILLICSAALAQSQAPASANELKYFRYLFRTLGSIDYSSSFIQNFESAVIAQFGLNAQEAAMLDSAGQSFRSVLASTRTSAISILSAKTSLTSADGAALAALKAQQDQMVQTLANQLLNSVRPQTAVRLRAPGDLMSTFKIQGAN